MMMMMIGFTKHEQILTAAATREHPKEKKKAEEGGRTAAATTSISGHQHASVVAVGYFQKFDPLFADPAEWGADAAHDGQGETHAQL